ncbi:bifunctional ADP-dependent NAD(P)H-hydrate dehydratase/NAD(P)H-hydrate epimerase, partial [Kribbia dieselivorans]|uniref:bifunctional ADP-dependent NAD(P)H-hydrate dehydratase/NAD(P)H-hydrate epimerase n=1 Tax=Kribbia dieselivorans TaxID=331526 RepID=UPI000A9A3015
GLPDWARPWIDAVDATAWVIAVDVPSGQDPAGGELDPDGVFADESVTFGSPKPVHLLPPTEAATGRLTVVDIGLDLRSDVPVVERLTRDDVADLWPTPDAADDKYTRGVLGLIAGGETYAGAAVLAATAAVSTGVGMLRYVGTPTPTDLVRSAVPEAVIGMGRVQAWVVGPGVDITATDDAAQAHLAAAWEALDSDLPVVVDAGGLDLIEGPRPGPTLLTPHAGECARLLARLSDGRDAYAGAFADVTAHDVQDAPVEHARALARLAHATVLLKGATTLVVTPDDGVPVRSQADAP